MGEQQFSSSLSLLSINHLAGKKVDPLTLAPSPKGARKVGAFKNLRSSFISGQSP